MVEELTACRVWEEPKVGQLFGEFYDSARESQMVLLVRDPRDVAASAFDASRKGGWRYEWHDRGATGRPAPDEKPNVFVRKRAERYLHHIGSAKRAYDAHRGRKVLIRYEDLKAETLGTMRRLCLALEIPADEKRLTWVVEKHSWENIPEEEKGEGKFY